MNGKNMVLDDVFLSNNIKKQTSKMSKKVVVVVPLYQFTLSYMEQISLIQLYKILGDYPICYVVPEKLKIHYKFEGLYVESFSDEYFDSVKAYSRFCMTAEFYKRFSDYEYMFLYQLDAFVFYDALDFFCSQKYDYIGAPWPWIFMRDTPIKFKYRVGNGGCSLRRVSSALRILQSKKEILSAVSNVERFIQAEDLFWSFCATIPGLKFKIANEKIARTFSLEGGMEKYIKKLTEKKLPFACHAWSRSVYFEMWKPWIEKMGYKFDGMDMIFDGDSWREYSIRYYSLRDYVIDRWRKYHKAEIYGIINKYIPNVNRGISLWGGGEYGMLSYRLMIDAGVKIVNFYDKDTTNSIDGLQYIKPDLKKIHTPIIISSLKYEKEITEKLNRYGFKVNEDFYCLSQLLDLMFYHYPLNACR